MAVVQVDFDPQLRPSPDFAGSFLQTSSLRSISSHLPPLASSSSAAYISQVQVTHPVLAGLDRCLLRASAGGLCLVDPTFLLSSYKF